MKKIHKAKSDNTLIDLDLLEMQHERDNARFAMKLVLGLIVVVVALSELANHFVR